MELMTTDIRQKLASSAAVASLRAEQEIAATFQSEGWSVVHGLFYADPVTGKNRELDVVASTSWRRFGDDKAHHVTLRTFAEVKTIRDYHLVFAPLREQPQYVAPECFWLGYHETEFAEFISNGHIIGTDADDMLAEFNRASVLEDRDLAIEAMELFAPESPFSASAFRETNTAHDRDLDSSVLWKASQAVFAARKAVRIASVSKIFDRLAGSYEVSKIVRRSAVEYLPEHLGDAMRTVEIVYPLIVVDAALWAVTEDDLRELRWCRLFEIGATEVTWCDIVRRQHVTSYVKHLTRHYERTLSKAGGMRTGGLTSR
jgi:hypothetical protein